MAVEYRTYRNWMAGLTVLLFLTMSLDAAARDKIRVNGYIYDEESGKRLHSVTVEVLPQSHFLTSNSRGFYEIDLKPGSFILSFSHLGYKSKEKELIINGDEEVRLDVNLQPSDFLMADFLVEAPSVMLYERSPGSIEVPVHYLNESASFLHSDIFRSIQLMPGVTAASDFSGGLHIRGGSPDQTLVLLDGATVYNPTHFYGFYSTFNPDVVDRVTLHKGAYPARFGGRMGSVIDVRNKRGQPDETSGTVSLGLLSSRVKIQGAQPAGTWLLAFRRSTLEPTLSVLRRMEESIPDSFHFYDLNASVGIHAGRHNRVDLSFYTSMDDLLFPLRDVQHFKLNYRNQTATLNWTRMNTDSFISTYSFSTSHYANTPAFDFDHTVIHKYNRVTDYSAKADFEWFASEKTRISAGAGVGHLTFTLDEHTDAVSIFSSEIENYQATAYLQGRFRLSQAWEIDAGLRGSHYSAGQYTRLEPRVSVFYNLSPTSRLHAAAGRYYQFASLITSEAFSGFDMWLSTAEHVPPSYSHQFSLGYSNTIRGTWDIEIEAYYREMRDLFVLDPFAGSLAGRSYEDLFYFEDGYAGGLEVYLSRFTGTLSGFVSYTLGAVRKRNPAVNDNRYYAPKYDQLHNFNIVTRLNLSANWTLSTVFSYGSGQPYTRPLGRTVIVDELSLAPINPIMVGDVNADRLPPYHRLDIGISRRDRLFNQVETELKLEVINVYSRRNVWFFHYQFPENDTSREAATMLPLLPSITYSLSF